MWKKFTQALGNFVQSLFNKNTPKRGLRRETGILEDSYFMKTDAPAQLNGDLAWDSLTIPTEVSFNINNIDFDELEKELEKLVSTSYQVLPKRHRVETLLISSIGNFEYDSIGVDLSQLEETGIAHYFCTSTKPSQQAVDEWCARCGKESWDTESEWQTVVVKNATLLEYPGGFWDWTEEE